MSTCPHCGSSHAADNHFCPATGQPIDLGPRLISLSLLDRFRIVTILGEGPIGIVVEVEEKGTGHRYAAKLIHPQFTRNFDAGEKTLEDAKRVAELDCRHIAKVVKVGRDEGAAISVVRELMTGECLQDRLEEKKRLPEEEAIKIAREILEALDAIHEAGVVDLDLSPADVFLSKIDEEEIVKLVDIGEYHIKRRLILDESEEFESRNYYAPEQYDTSRQVNPKSDIYAAGAILYQMVVGEIPSNTKESSDLTGENISNDLAQIIRKALSSTPHNRFQSAREFIEALNKVGEKPTEKSASSKVETGPAAVQGPSPEPEADEGEVEQEQPSVIVDMPEMAESVEKPPSKKLYIGIAAAVVIVIAVILMSVGTKKEKQPEKIQVVVKIQPKSATVHVDGSHIDGNPVTLDVIPDQKLHTIAAKANGYEAIERDVKFDKSKTVEFSLIEIIQPDEEEKPQAEILKIEEQGEEQAELPSPPEPGPIQEEPVEKPEEKAVEPEPEEKPKAEPKPVEQKAKQKAKPKPAPKPKAKPKPKPENKKKSREGFTTTNPFG